MHVHGLIIFLISMGWVSGAQNCSATQKAEAKERLFEHLGLDKSDSPNPRMWPLIFRYKDTNPAIASPEIIYMDLYVIAITNVNEKAQSLTTQVQLKTAWPNYNTTWSPLDFCGLYTFPAPKDKFWTPDIVVKESINTEFGTKESPYVLLFNMGYTISSEILALTTTCKMDLYKFPLDVQHCNITFQSTLYSVEDLKIYAFNNRDWITFSSKNNSQAQGEWELLDITVHNASAYDLTKLLEMDQLVYKITIRRRPHQYIVTIIVPVFFFVVLDVISSFIHTSAGDKLSFKVTLLVSISVVLLILKDMLPSTSIDIPLIGKYCGGIFCLMAISLLETIIVNYLMVKGSVMTSAVETKATDSVSVQQNPPDSKQREKTCLCCTRVARIIDMIFLVLYVITVIVFLSVFAWRWLSES